MRSPLAFGLVVLCLAPPAAVAPRHTVRMEREVRLMGTQVRLEGDFPDRQTGLVQLEGLIQQLEGTEEELSTWRSESLLSRLNRHPQGVWFELSTPICGLFRTLFEWTAETGSAFDPALGRLVEAWDLRGAGRVPSPEALREAMQNSGLRRSFSFDPAVCRIARLRPALLDAGAFGKGEGLERARRWAEEAGLSRWLIDLGGQIAVATDPAASIPWSVGIAHPVERTRTLFELALEGGSLATSGGSERDRRAGGRRIPHILDPRRGVGATFQGSVLVWHENSLAADILSTALFVMGVEEGLPWAEAHQIAACYLVPSRSGQQGEVALVQTSWFKSRFRANPPAVAGPP